MMKKMDVATQRKVNGGLGWRCKGCGAFFWTYLGCVFHVNGCEKAKPYRRWW